MLRIVTPAEAARVEAGARARREGKTEVDCPYPAKTRDWSGWMAGWRRPSMYLGEED